MIFQRERVYEFNFLVLLYSVTHTHTTSSKKRRRSRSKSSETRNCSEEELNLHRSSIEAFQDPHCVSSRCEYFYSLSYLNIYIYKNPGRTMLEQNVAYLVFKLFMYSARLLETTTLSIDCVSQLIVGTPLFVIDCFPQSIILVPAFAIDYMV